jgi:ferric-dicitrate binding protein FerR (iron transport regulator)
MPQQWEELVCRYLDGRADAEEVRRLDQAVQSDRQVARMLVEMAALESQLGRMMSLERTAAEIATDQPTVTATTDSPLLVRTRQARRQQRRWRIIGVATAVAACAAVVALMVFNAVRPAPSPSPTGSSLVAEVVLVSGTVERLPGGTGQPGGLDCGDRVEPGDTFRVGSAPGTELMLRYADGTTVRFFQTAAGGLIDDGDAKRVQLDAGQLLADITPQPAGREMTFATPDAEAKVLGTQLRLTALPSSSVLEVIRGEVEFKRLHDPQIAIVTARERIDSGPDLPLLPRQIPSHASRIPLPAQIDRPVGLAHDGLSLWVSNGPQIYKIRAFDGAIDESATLDVSDLVGPQGANGLAWDGLSLWVADYFGSRILRLDPVTGTVQKQFSTMDNEAEDSARSRRIKDVAVAGGYVWGLGYGDIAGGKRGTVIFQMTLDGEVVGRFDAPQGFTYFAITHHHGNVLLHGVGPDRSGRIFMYPARGHDGEPVKEFYGAKANTMVTGLCSDRSGRLWLVSAGIHDRTGIHTTAEERWIQAIEFTELQEVNEQ